MFQVTEAVDGKILVKEKNTTSSYVMENVFPEIGFVVSSESLARMCHSINTHQLFTINVFLYPACSKYGQYRCDNDICIEKADVCNGVDNCRDDSDERKCKSKGRTTQYLEPQMIS